MRKSLIIAAMVSVAGTAHAAPASRNGDLVAPGGTAIGMVGVTEAPKGVILRIEASRLAPGWHGAHLHEKADCSDAAFKNAGGHVHMGATMVHGLLNPAANESGDLPNIFVGADGKASVELYSTMVSLTGAGGRAALLDADGSALVIHANTDDYTTQPIGGAGARVACAVIK